MGAVWWDWAIIIIVFGSDGLNWEQMCLRVRAFSRENREWQQPQQWAKYRRLCQIPFREWWT